MADATTPQQHEKLLTADLLMGEMGIYDLGVTKELIVRDEKITGIDDQCAQQFASLELLSLSHNCISSLQHFNSLVNLLELNLNFNRIESLDHLQCFNLQKLFLANNQLKSIASLRKFQRLNTLSLYGNQLQDLDASLQVCRQLPKLRALDIGGNPCSMSAEYKYQVIRQLPRLKELDGERLSALDRDLCDEMLTATNGQNEYTTAQDTLRSGATGSLSRPFTAPASGQLLRSQSLSNPRPFDPFASGQMPRGQVRLFQDDFLNNNPILLEYLAQQMSSKTLLDTDSVVNETKAKFTAERVADTTKSSQQKGFVERMRAANASQSSLPEEPAEAVVQADDGPHTDSGANQASNELITTTSPSLSNEPTKTLSSSASATTIMITTHANIDPSDPQATIRKLVKHIEMLSETIAGYQQRSSSSYSTGGAATDEQLLAENRRLMIENNNIPILQDEIEDLKKRLVGGGGAQPTSDATTRLNQLEEENKWLKKENERLQRLVDAHQQRPMTASDNSPAQSSIETKDQVLQDSALVDAELTELILQNEVSLQLLRNDIKNTKKEMDLRREAEYAEKISSLVTPRPATSAGRSGALSSPFQGNQRLTPPKTCSARLLFPNSFAGPSKELLPLSKTTGTDCDRPSETNVLQL